jgi:hypothetical protein
MTDTTARVITGISAGAAAASLLIAYLTYRRLRPRIAVKVELVSGLVNGAGGRPRLRVVVRLINRSASQVQVEKLHLHYRYAKGEEAALHRDGGGWPYEPEEPLIIEPMGAVKVNADFDMGMNPRRLRVDTGNLTARLSDGRRARGKLDDYKIASMNIAFRDADKK